MKPAKDQLVEMYVTRDLSQQQIGRELGVSQGSVCSWLKEHGIPSRNRGRAGEKNPFFGRRHSAETKTRISRANSDKFDNALFIERLTTTQRAYLAGIFDGEGSVY